MEFIRLTHHNLRKQFELQLSKTLFFFVRYKNEQLNSVEVFSVDIVRTLATFSFHTLPTFSASTEADIMRMSILQVETRGGREELNKSNNGESEKKLVVEIFSAKFQMKTSNKNIFAFIYSGRMQYAIWTSGGFHIFHFISAVCSGLFFFFIIIFASFALCNG